MDENNNRTYTISEAASALNVTTVRIHGLLRDGQLILSETPKQVGGRFVKAITHDSIQEYLIKRVTRSEKLAERKAAKMEAQQAAESRPRKEGKQYILRLEPDEVAKVEALGIDLRPRYSRTAALSRDVGPDGITTDDMEPLDAIEDANQLELHRMQQEA